MDATFFTVSDARYFLGTVGLINSLRVQGHDEEIVVLDCGFTEQQRAALLPQCTVMPLPEEGAVNAAYYKIVAPRLRGKSTKVIIDGDMIVTAHLGELIRAAESGKVVAYADPDPNRWFAEWEQIYELSAAPRRQTYVNSGIVFLNSERLPLLLDQWWSACQKTFTKPTFLEGAPDSPTNQADQDAFNAILMGNYPAGVVQLRPSPECPMEEDLKRGVEILNRETLACRYRKHKTYILHSTGGPKPWSSPARVRKDAYVLLFRRLLTQSSSAIRLPPEMIPNWLRSDVKSRAVLTGFHYRNRGTAFYRRVSWAVRRRLM